VIRVLVADDQTLIRVGIATLLDEEADLELVDEAADGHAAVAAVRATRPDVVLMDIRMPRTDGLAALREIAADPLLAGVRVIMLTTFELDEYVFEALRADGAPRGRARMPGRPAEGPAVRAGPRRWRW